MASKPDAVPVLLFVCSGNICRSSMAAAIAQRAADSKTIALRAESCGTRALVGEPAEPNAQEMVSELGLSLAGHRARQVTREMVLDAALVVALTRLHGVQLELLGSDLAECIVSFGDLTGLGDIPDPFGASLDVYCRVRDMLVEGMPDVLREFKARIARSANSARVP